MAAGNIPTLERMIGTASMDIMQASCFAFSMAWNFATGSG
jgi:hypothetical protein